MDSFKLVDVIQNFLITVVTSSCPVLDAWCWEGYTVYQAWEKLTYILKLHTGYINYKHKV